MGTIKNITEAAKMVAAVCTAILAVYKVYTALSPAPPSTRVTA